MTAPSPAVPKPPQTVTFLRAALVIVGAVAFLDVAFYFLSHLYFDSHTSFVVGVGEIPAYSADQILQIRIAFVIFSAVVGATAIAAAAAGKIMGHVLPVAMGIGSFIAGIIALSRGMPSALWGALLVLGGLMPWLALLSWRRSRPAWAFLIAICSVYAVVLFFGAPTVHRILGIGLWTTLILPGLNLVAFVSLIQQRAYYRD